MPRRKEVVEVATSDLTSSEQSGDATHAVSVSLSRTDFVPRDSALLLQRMCNQQKAAERRAKREAEGSAAPARKKGGVKKRAAPAATEVDDGDDCDDDKDDDYEQEQEGGEAQTLLLSLDEVSPAVCVWASPVSLLQQIATRAYRMCNQTSAMPVSQRWS